MIIRAGGLERVPQPKAGWKQRRSAAERKADGNYKPRQRQRSQAQTVALAGPAWRQRERPSLRVYNLRVVALSQRRAYVRTRAGQPSRAGTVAITAHLPREVRDR